MSHEELLSHTAGELVSLYRAREVSPVEATRSCLSRIEMLNSKVRAYARVLGDQALEQARQAEQAYLRGRADGLLCGVPVSVKDVYWTKDIPTTWGVRGLAGYRPHEDSSVVIRLREAGAILLGKTNVDTSLAWSTQSYPHLIGPSRNPWDLARTAGWSSGGSGASVAALFDYASVGSDTAGSIRIPAAFCGAVGLKPTFGRVSKYGTFPYSASFDHCGPMARSAYDCALLLSAIAGYDPKDPTTRDREVPDFTRSLGETIRALRLGLPRAVAWVGNDPNVTMLVDKAIDVLVELGVETKEMDLPYHRDDGWVNVLSILETMEMAEEFTTLVRSDSYAAHFVARNAGMLRRLLNQGALLQQAAQRRYAEIFRDVDVIVMPTVPIPAPRFTDDNSPFQLPGELFVDLVSRYTRIASFIGYPAISVPCGFTTEKMPVAFQIIGRPFEEETVLRIAYRFEQASGWHVFHPPLSYPLS